MSAARFGLVSWRGEVMVRGGERRSHLFHFEPSPLAGLVQSIDIFHH